MANGVRVCVGGWVGGGHAGQGPEGGHPADRVLVDMKTCREKHTGARFSEGRCALLRARWATIVAR